MEEKNRWISQRALKLARRHGTINGWIGVRFEEAKILLNEIFEEIIAARLRVDC